MPNRILIIEDESGIRDLLVKALTSFDCITADRISAALGIIRANDLNLIFCDLELPDSSGFETLVKLLEAAGNIPVVVGSGSENHYNALRALSLGAVSYIGKPYNIDILPERLERAIVRGRYIAKLRAERDAAIQRAFEAEKVKAPRPRLTKTQTAIIIAAISALAIIVAAVVTGLMK